MKTCRLGLILTVPFVLSACESMNNFFMDSERDAYSSGAVVTQPVPRAKIASTHAAKQTSSASTSQIAPLPSQVQPEHKAASATPVNSKQTTVVPNVAPSLGE